MRTRRNNPGNNLHVSGLSHKIDTRDLEAAFAKTGRVKKASVMFDPHTRESRGFGFVTMETPEEADAAIAALNGMELGGKSINVEKVCLCFRVSTNFPTYITRSPPFLLFYQVVTPTRTTTPLHSTTYTPSFPRTCRPSYLQPSASSCRYVCTSIPRLPPPYYSHRYSLPPPFLVLYYTLYTARVLPPLARTRVLLLPTIRYTIAVYLHAQFFFVHTPPYCAFPSSHTHTHARLSST
ncbi:hypothetical protein DFH06DRAFT_1003423 [Mycena polygramma]|nr:hypothetical protein DFH06DRAFT_1003423 [Mycena polygramma]